MSKNQGRMIHLTLVFNKQFRKTMSINAKIEQFNFKFMFIAKRNKLQLLRYLPQKYYSKLQFVKRINNDYLNTGTINCNGYNI